MKRILTIVLLLALTVSMFAVGAAYAGADSVVNVSETERIAVSFAQGTTGGFFGTSQRQSLANGESLTMEFTINESTIPAQNWNMFFVPTSSDIVNKSTDWVYSGFDLIFGNEGYPPAQNHVSATNGKTWGSSATIEGTLRPITILQEGKTLRVVYTYKTGNQSSLIFYQKDLLADEYTEVFALKGIADNKMLVKNFNFIFGVNGGAASINPKDGNFYMELSDYFIYKTTSAGISYVDGMTYCLNGMRFESFEAVPEANKAVQIVANNTQQGNDVAYMFNYATLSSDAVVKFDIPYADDGFSIVLDKDLNGIAGDETFVAIPEGTGSVELSFVGGKAVLKDGASKTVLKEVAFDLTSFYFGLYLKNEGTAAKNAFVDNVSVASSGYAYEYGFDVGLAKYFKAVSTSSKNFAYVSDEYFTVNYCLYDGTVFESQNIGYGNNAVIPNGAWVNMDDVSAQSKFITKDKVIFLEREGDNVGGFFVNVEEGKLKVSSTFGDTLGVYNEGDSVTVIARDKDAREDFLGWSDGTAILSEDEEYTFNVTKNTNLKAVFKYHQYDISVDGGYIDGASDTSITVDAYTEITVVAEEKEGYTFSGWMVEGTDLLVSTDFTYTFTALESLSLYNVYTPIPYEINVVNGVIASTMTGSAMVDFDSEVEIIAVAPGDEYEFIGWVESNYNSTNLDSEDILSTDSTLKFFVPGELTIYAVWMKDAKYVVVENGHVEGGSDLHYVDCGTQITIIADEAPEGEQFWRWYNNLDNSVSKNAMYDVVITDNVIYTAKYETAEYVMNGTGATIKVNGADVEDVNESEDVFGAKVLHGDQVTYIANAPEYGYVFAGWLDGKVIVSTDSEYTFTAEEGVDLVATYAEGLFTVNVENGYVNGQSTAEIAYNASIYVLAKNPEYGYAFDGWYVGDEKLSSETKFLFTVTGETTISAKYVKVDYTLKVVSGTIKGDVENDREESAPYLTEMTVVAAEPLAGYVFVGWSNGGSIVSRYPEYTFAIERDTTLTAKYARASFIITVVDGTINGMTTYYLDAGQDATVVTTEKTGHTFKGWSDGEKIVSTDKTYTFKVEKAVTMTAVYDPIVYTVKVNGGTIGDSSKTEGEYAYGEDVIVKATDERTFAGWYLDGELVSASASYTITVEGDVTLTAKYNGASGCGCGSIAPTDKTNGGNMMIFGILAIVVLAIIAMRKGKKMAKYASKALMVVLCVAVVASAVMVPGAAVASAAEVNMSDAMSTTGINLTSNASEMTYYFPVDDYAFGTKVRVSMDIKLNDAEKAVNENYSVAAFYTAGDEYVDDALPISSWTKLTFETYVIAANGGFNVMLTVKNATGLDMDIRNLTISDDVLADELLAGATMWMLPNITSEQMMSFVIKTASGKIIVIDGGTAACDDYLLNFINTLGSQVDYWFISHYHSDHIAAMTSLIKRNAIKIKEVYCDLPTYDEIDQYAAQDMPSQWYYDLMDIIEKGTPCVETWHAETGKAGTTVKIDDVNIKILNDQMNFTNNYGNETNVNFRMDTGVLADGTVTGESVLFLGDSGIGCGSWLVNNCLADIQGCTIVQAAHHGQNGVSEATYNQIKGEIYLYCAPIWLWDCGSNGIGSGTYNTLVERNWQRKMGTVVKTYNMANGLVTFR